MTEAKTRVRTGVREIENTWIEMPDGCRLAARLWLPEASEDVPVPAILEFHPYGKRDGTATRDARTYANLAANGYACARVDLRGSGESDGVLEGEYTPQELADGVSVINWLAEQPWCSGKVAMMGISWSGFNALQVAALQPEPLKAIVTVCSTDDRYADDIHYKGGCLLGENLGWGAAMLAFSSRPPDPALAGDGWFDTWMQRLEGQAFMAADWTKHQRRDAFWKHGSVCEDFSQISAAVLAVGGWNDSYSNAVPRLLNGLNSPVKAIIGPWTHSYPHIASPGPQADFLAEVLRWLGFWLKGEPTGVLRDPAMRAYIMDSRREGKRPEHIAGRWLGEGCWPPASTEQNRLYLTGSGLAPEPEKPALMAVCSPQHTGLASGEFCIMGDGPEFAGEQTPDDENSLVFDTAPTGVELDIAGAAELELEFICDRPQAKVCVRLCDVAPDGNSTRITYALQNLAHIAGHDEPQALEPGERYFTRIQLDDVGWRLPEGHKLRLAISTSYWPIMWPAPEPAELQIITSRSWLTLPVRSPLPGEEALQMASPPAAPEPELDELRDPSHSRKIEKNSDTGVWELTIVDDFGLCRDAEHGLVTGEIAREVHSIHPDDPLSARVDTHWTQESVRGDDAMRTETFCAMSASAGQFHLSARVEAYHNDKLVFEREMSEDIDRDHN